MAGNIYLGFDLSQPVGSRRNDSYVSTSFFQAFGDLLTESLSECCTPQMEQIKEMEVLMLYKFTELSSSDYNLVIQTIRRHIAGLSNPSEWQQKGIRVWNEMAEPFIRKDERYDFAFHGEEPPPQPQE